MNETELQLAYSDVDLIPKYSGLASRNDGSTEVEFLGYKFQTPCIPANMLDVIDVRLAEWMSKNRFFYIMHRFGMSNFEFVKKAKDWNVISISVGVNDHSYDLDKVKDTGIPVDFITIDVAHGHHQLVKWKIDQLKGKFPDTKIIAGNVATREAVHDLIEWGADAIKIGIGGGSICTTRLQTGFHVPMFSCVLNCCSDMYWETTKRKVPKLEIEPVNVPIIADGGVQVFGDIAKALVAGATMVMCGKLFASCVDSPAKMVRGHKLYRGSTSYEAKGVKEHVEGRSIEILPDMTVEERFEEQMGHLRSAISYAGGSDLSAFNGVEWMVHK